MTLPKATVPIAFTGGLDQKRPEKQSLPGHFLVLQDCVRRKYSLVEKRYGTLSLLSTVLANVSTIADGRRIAPYKDSLLLFSSSRAYAYSQSTASWVDKGSLVSTQVTSTPLVRSASIQAQADIANAFNMTVTVYEDSRGGVRYSIYDDSTGAAIVYDVSLSATAVRPKVVVLNQHFLILYIEPGTTTLTSRTIPIGSPTSLSGTTTVLATCASACYDVDVLNSWAFFAVNNTSSGITLGYVLESGVVGSPANGSVAPRDITSVSTLGTGCITVAADATNSRLYVSYYDQATDNTLKTSSVSTDLTNLSPAVALINSATPIRNVTQVLRSDGTVRVFYEITPNGSSDSLSSLVRSSLVTWAGPGVVITASGSTLLKRSVGLASKAFATASDEYVSVVYESALQPTYFLVRLSDGFIAAKMTPSSAGGLTRDTAASLKTGLGHALLDESGNYIFALQVRNRLAIESGGKILSTQTGLNKLSVSFSAATFPFEVLGEDLHVSGGILLAYDGTQASEHGFHVYPETPAAPALAGGSLAAGDYTTCFLYEWIDGRGQIHRSAPSIPIVQTVGANAKMTFAVPTLRLTSKPGQVNIVAYMAAVNLATVFYRLGSVANDATVDTVSFAVSTAASPTKEILYTVSGAVSNIAAPASKCIKSHKNRIWLGGLETNQLWYSKEFVVNEGVAFSDLNQIPIEGLGGDVTALAELDGALIIFKRDRIYLLAGEGPLDSGQQNDYGTPQRIAADVGTTIPNSVADLPVGVIFKSAKGFFLLDRTLRTKYIGAPVEDFNSLTVTSATVLTDQNEVRFTTLEGTALVYNFYFDQWSTFSNYDAVSSCAALGTYCTLRSTGIVRTEHAGFYDDDGRRFNMAMETSWLALAQLQGFQRIYRLYLLGDFVSHCFTKLQVAYDYEQAYNETVYFDSRSGLVSSDVYGSGATYGSNPSYGNNGGSTVYQWLFQPNKQKCEAIKLRIEDVDTIGTLAGGSFKLTALTAVIGRKAGGLRLPGGKQIRN